MKNNNKQININLPIMSLLILIAIVATYAGIQSNNTTLTIVSIIAIVFTIIAICMLEGININIRNIKSNKRIISTIVISIISVLATITLSCILYQYHRQYNQTILSPNQHSQYQYQQHNKYIVSINLDTNSNLLKITAIDTNTFADDTQDIYYNIPVELLKFPTQLNYHYYYQPTNVLLHLADGRLTIDNLNNNNNTTTESDIFNMSDTEYYEMLNEQLESNCNNNAYYH